MTLPDELLDLADELAKPGSVASEQVRFRRAVSSAYYALFHLLTWEASSVYSQEPEVRRNLCRTYTHTQIKEVSKRIVKGEWPKALRSTNIRPVWSKELEKMSRSFVELQEFRHKADYDLNHIFQHAEVIALIKKARDAFMDWQMIKNTDEAKLFLQILHVWGVLDKDRNT